VALTNETSIEHIIKKTKSFKTHAINGFDLHFLVVKDFNVILREEGETEEERPTEEEVPTEEEYRQKRSTDRRGVPTEEEGATEEEVPTEEEVREKGWQPLTSQTPGQVG
jgi:hypothetical protein